MMARQSRIGSGEQSERKTAALEIGIGQARTDPGGFEPSGQGARGALVATTNTRIDQHDAQRRVGQREGVFSDSSTCRPSRAPSRSGFSANALVNSCLALSYCLVFR